MKDSFRRRSRLLVFAVLATVVTVIVQAQVAPERKRVSVEAFDYTAARTSVKQVFGTDQNIGLGFQAMLTKRLDMDSKIIVLAGRDSGAQGMTVQSADARLDGDIAVFGHYEEAVTNRGDKSKIVDGVGLIRRAFGELASSMRSEKAVAVVVIHYRLVDPETSEVIAAGEARGDSSRKSSGSHGFMEGYSVGTGLKIDMTSPNFADTAIGEASVECVNKIASALVIQVAKLPARKINVNARVAYISGDSVTINAGADAGVVSGDRFEVVHLISEIRDPKTHEILGLATEKVGEMIINVVKARVATGAFTGSGKPQVSDQAKKL